MLFEHLRGDHDGFVPQEVGTLGSILGEQAFGQLLKSLAVFARSNSIPNLQQHNQHVVCVPLTHLTSTTPGVDCLLDAKVGVKVPQSVVLICEAFQSCSSKPQVGAVKYFGHQKIACE